jgi:putative copper resistance protein D
MSMSGQALQFDVLKTVWTQTQFGTVSEIRVAFWFAAFALAVISVAKRKFAFQNLLNDAQLLLSGSLLGSLAWAGHGQESSPWHLLADILHLLAAGIWPAGLLPFALLLKKLRHFAPANWLSAAALVRRFSASSLATVALLAGTGLVNTWFLVGSPVNLIRQPYGRWLSVKIVLFGIAVAIGAVNLLRLKPRLLDEVARSQSAGVPAAQIQFNVTLELFLAAGVVIIVAILGILPP